MKEAFTAQAFITAPKDRGSSTLQIFLRAADDDFFGVGGHEFFEVAEAIGGGAFFGSEFFAGEGVLRDEGLHDVAVAPLNESAGFVHLFVGVEGLDNGGSEFVVDATAHDELDGFFNFFSLSEAGDFGVAGESGFDVHGDVVDEGEAFFQYVGPRAVGVEFDFEAALAEELNQFDEVGGEGGFAAGDADGIDPVGFEACADFVDPFPSEADLFGAHEGGVVAEAARKIAAGKKKDPAEASGEVDHGGFFENCVNRRLGGLVHINSLNTKARSS